MSTIFYNHGSAIPFDNGSAAAPSISFADDPNTGIYRLSGDSGRFYFAADGTAVVRIDGNGLALQDKTLYIQSGRKINFDYGVSNNYYIVKNSTTLNMHSPVNLSLQTNSSHRLYINQSGNVGIGTTSPAYKFVVEAGGTYAGLFNSTNRYKVGLSHNGTEEWWFVADSDGSFRLHENAVGDQFTIKAGGNVGIGTTSPSAKLDVNGGINASSITVGDGNISRVRIGGNTAMETNSGFLYIDPNNSFGSGIYINNAVRVDGGLIGSYNEDLQLRTGTTTRMTLSNSTGNVGIGTTSPSQKLQVAGAVEADAFETYSDDHIRVLNPGGAGAYLGNSVTGAIKITLPHSWTNTMMSFTVRVYDYSGGESFDFRVHGYNYTGEYWVNTSAYLISQPDIDRNFTVRFGHDGTNCCITIGEVASTWSYLKVAVTDFQASHGLMGIGDWSSGWDITAITTLPSNIDRVHANTQIANWSRNGQNLYYGSGTGNVGIGTTAPSTKLHVATGTASGAAGLNANSAIAIDSAANQYLQFRTSSGSSGIMQGILFTDNGNNAFIGYKEYTGAAANTYGESVHFAIRDFSASDAGSGFYFGTTNDPAAGVQTPLMFIKSNGRVGIGTTAPAHTLDVNGTAKATTLRVHNNDPAIHFVDSADSTYEGMFRYRNNFLEWLWGGGMKLRVSADGGMAISQDYSTASIPTKGLILPGNVGIGTNSPDYKLHVVNDQASHLIGMFIANSRAYGVGQGAYGAGIWLGKEENGGNQPMGAIIGSPSAETNSTEGQLIFQTRTSSSLSDRMVIRNNGNVGIGTMNPSQKLHVEGNIYNNGSLYVGNSIYHIGDTDTYVKFEDNLQRFFAAGEEMFRFNSSLVVVNEAAGNNDFRVKGSSDDNLIYTKGSLNRVGIGTVDPRSKLEIKNGTTGQSYTNQSGLLIDVNGTSNSYSSLHVGSNSGANNFVVTNAGNTGLGTASPNNKLQVVGDIDASNYRIGNGIKLEANSSYTMLRDANGVRKIYLGGTADETTYIDGNAHKFRTSGGGTVKMTIASGGNVGIGTTSPTYKLVVAGTSHSHNIYPAGAGVDLYSTGNYAAHYQSSFDWYTGVPGTGSFKMRLNSSGNLGIGTTSPARKLHIGGSGGSSGGIMLSPSSGDVEIQFQDSGTTNAYITLKDGTQQMRFRDDAANVLNVDFGTERVGIMTTTPQRVFDVKLPNSSVIGASIAGRISVGNYQGLHFGYAEEGNNLYRKSAIVFERTDLTSNDAQGKIHILNGPQGSSQSATLADAKLTIAENGNVGIGTTSPNSKLEVYGSGSTVLDIQGSQGQLFSVSDSLTGSLMSVNDISGLPILEVFDTDKVVMGEYGTNALVVTGSNVGIGTDTPASKLTVAGASGADPLFRVQSTGTALSEDVFMAFNRDDNDVQGFAVGIDSGDNSFKISEDGDRITDNPRLTIAFGGNVGIGTTSPASKLDVNGSLKVQSGDTFGFDGNHAAIYMDAAGRGLSGKFGSNGYARNLIKSDGGATISIGENTSLISRILLDAGSTSANGYISLQTNQAERVRIANNGNVGIGTTSPSQKLHVSGNTRSTNFYVDNAIYHDGDTDTYIWFTDNRIRIDAGGVNKFDSNNTYAIQNTANTFRALTTDSITPSADRTHNLGLDSARWQIVFCETLDSAGLHEKNLENPEGERSVGDYATGTVMVWKGGKNVPCTVEADHMRMGIAVEGVKSPLIQGAEPVLVTGIANEGDYLICSEKEGHARAISRQEMLERNLYDCVLGKALESGEGESYLLKVWITI